MATKTTAPEEFILRIIWGAPTEGELTPPLLAKSRDLSNWLDQHRHGNVPIVTTDLRLLLLEDEDINSQKLWTAPFFREQHQLFIRTPGGDVWVADLYDQGWLGMFSEYSNLAEELTLGNFDAEMN